MVASYEVDFTEARYRLLLEQAKSQYRFSSFVGDTSETESARLIFWRHDVDFSLNRSLSLSQIERDAHVQATYLVDMHSPFYNLHEANQAALLEGILENGHELGIHFDAHFHNIMSVDELEFHLGHAKDHLTYLLGVAPVAFSFHNPSTDHLQFMAPEYAGLVNCYSAVRMNTVAYCSDSNGYWRFRELSSVLSDVPTKDLQVLTHPDWWQKESAAPRRRVQRAVYGRASSVMRGYDEGLASSERLNLSDPSWQALKESRGIDARERELLDLLWSCGSHDLVVGAIRQRISSPASNEDDRSALQSLLTKLEDEGWFETDHVKTDYGTHRNAPA